MEDQTLTLSDGIYFSSYEVRHEILGRRKRNCRGLRTNLAQVNHNLNKPDTIAQRNRTCARTFDDSMGRFPFIISSEPLTLKTDPQHVLLGIRSATVVALLQALGRLCSSTQSVLDLTTRFRSQQLQLNKVETTIARSLLS